LNKTDKRQNLVRTAANVFVEKGIQNATMTDVAKEAGVDRRTIYRYFENKNNLVVECVIFALKIGNEIQDRLVEKQSGNGLEKFLNFQYDLVKEEDHHDFIKLVTDFDRLQEVRFNDLDETLITTYIKEASHSFNINQQLLSEGVADGSIKNIDTAEVAKTIHNVIWAVLQKQHFANEYLHNKLEVDFSDIIKGQLEMYEDYLKGEKYEIKK
jgi:AcrR family transcriptional regulator